MWVSSDAGCSTSIDLRDGFAPGRSLLVMPGGVKSWVVKDSAHGSIRIHRVRPLIEAKPGIAGECHLPARKKKYSRLSCIGVYEISYIWSIIYYIYIQNIGYPMKLGTFIDSELQADLDCGSISFVIR